MKRERLIYIGVLLLVFAGVFGVYQFYFSAKLERYAQHKQLLDTLRNTEAQLKKTFGNAQPDDVIRDHRGKVEAWNEAIATRIPFFSDADWREHETPPSDVFILQFWYGDETKRMVTELWEKAQAKYGAQVYQRMPDGFPMNVQPMFGVAYAEEWQGKSIDEKLVNSQLERLGYGISALEMLMDKNALKINSVAIEELGASGFLGQAAKYVRLKISFMMEAKDLVTFLEDLRTADTFYSVEGMRVSHPYVLARYEPQLNVDMFLLRTKQDETINLTAAPLASAEAGYEGSFGSSTLPTGGSPSRLPSDAEEEPGTMGKAWKWFKRNILYTN